MLVILMLMPLILTLILNRFRNDLTYLWHLPALRFPHQYQCPEAQPLGYQTNLSEVRLVLASRSLDASSTVYFGDAEFDACC